MTVRIGLLRMMELADAGRSVHGPYTTLFEMMFGGQTVDLLDVPVHEGATPVSLDECDVWIVTGSPASVYDDLEWIRTAEELVCDAMRTETPLVGICFGHQLVAQALGGRVEKVGVEWGLGAQSYETIERLGWFPQGDVTMTVLASHQDQVTVAPSDATVWSTAEYCPIAGMTIGTRLWTMQGHPEFTPELVRALYDSRRERLGDQAVDRARSTLDSPLSNAEVAQAIVRFAGAD